jgi:hypothetical protein
MSLPRLVGPVMVAVVDLKMAVKPAARITNTTNRPTSARPPAILAQAETSNRLASLVPTTRLELLRSIRLYYPIYINVIQLIGGQQKPHGWRGAFGLRRE